MSQHLRYRPEIDGLRALAVLPVILFHFNSALMSGGFVGVDMFFVISGYLITQIIVRESAARSFTLMTFWARRVKRIMPALMVVLATTVAVTLLISFPDTWYAIGIQCCSALTMVANIVMWKISGNYWAPSAGELPLLHTWSLSLEEQFYLFYPLLLVLFLKIPRHRALLASVAVIVGFGLSVYGTHNHPTGSFFLLPTRVWELGAGCWLALLNRPEKSSSTLSSMGVVCILVSFYLINDTLGIPGYVTLLPVVGTGLVLHYSDRLHDQKFSLATVLTNRVVTYIGKISYSLYLWHWPVMVLGKEWQRGRESNSSAYLLLIPVLSILSYHFIEQPARKSKRAVFRFVAGGFVLLGATSVFLAFFLVPSPGPLPFNTTTWMGDLYNINPHPPITPRIVKVRMVGIDIPTKEISDPSLLSTGGVVKSYGGATPSVVMIGSSHALMWAPIIDDICEKLGVSVSFQAANGTPGYVSIPNGSESVGLLSVEDKRLFDEGKLNSLLKWKPKVLLIAEVYRDVLVEKYRDFLSDPMFVDTQIVFIEQPPRLDIGDVNAPRYVAWRNGMSVEGIGVLEVQDTSVGKRALQELAEEFENISIIPTADLYLKDGKAVVRIKKDILYIDDDHLSLAGVELGRPRIEAVLQTLLSPSPSSN